MERVMAVVSMKQFLEAGVHFGHQTRRWNPKMEPYIYGAKSGIHIIDLRKSLQQLKDAYEYVKEATASGRTVLFVGTKSQIQKLIKEEAERCDSYYINHRWLGGLLTNFTTIKQSIAQLKGYEAMAGEDGAYEGIIKKEALRIERKREKLERSLGGVKNMKGLPSVVFIVDCKKEHIAVKEAQKLNIPIIALVDTNCDPSNISHPIPANDDSPRAVRLFASVIASAILEGKALRAERVREVVPEEESKKASDKAEKISKNEALEAPAKEKEATQKTEAPAPKPPKAKKAPEKNVKTAEKGTESTEEKTDVKGKESSESVQKTKPEETGDSSTDKEASTVSDSTEKAKEAKAVSTDSSADTDENSDDNNDSTSQSE